MSAQPTATAAAAAAPLSHHAAVTILGSMLLLIAALTVVLVQTTWASANARDTGTEILAPADYHPDVPATKDLARH